MIISEKIKLILLKKNKVLISNNEQAFKKLSNSITKIITGIINIIDIVNFKINISLKFPKYNSKYVIITNIKNIYLIDEFFLLKREK